MLDKCLHILDIKSIDRYLVSDFFFLNLHYFLKFKFFVLHEIGYVKGGLGINKFKFKTFFFNVYGHFACIYAPVLCECSAFEGQKRLIRPPGSSVELSSPHI